MPPTPHCPHPVTSPARCSWWLCSAATASMTPARPPDHVARIRAHGRRDAGLPDCPQALRCSGLAIASTTTLHGIEPSPQSLRQRHPLRAKVDTTLIGERDHRCVGPDHRALFISPAPASRPNALRHCILGSIVSDAIGRQPRQHIPRVRACRLDHFGKALEILCPASLMGTAQT